MEDISLYDQYQGDNPYEMDDEGLDEDNTPRIDVLKSWNDDPETKTEVRTLIEDIASYYSDLREFRRKSEKVKDFIEGKHWNQDVEDPDAPGTFIKEEELILRKGRQPIVNNQIRQIHKNLKGQYRDNDYKPTARARDRDKSRVSEMLTAALQYATETNNVREIDASVFDEFLFSGSAIWRTSMEWKSSRNIVDISVDPVHPSRCGWNTDVEHPLLDDLHTFFVIIDVPLDQIKMSFGYNEDEAEKYVCEFFSVDNRRKSSYSNYDTDRLRNISVLVNESQHGGSVRILEIWQKKFKKKVYAYDPVSSKEVQYQGDIETALAQVEEDNQARLYMGQMQGLMPEQIPLLEPEIKSDQIWYYYYTTPQGDILDMGESPYWHEEHPFTIKLYPMVDGKNWGLMYDFLDQNAMINRTISMLDHVMATSAKNLLMIPEDVIPEGWTAEDFADQWNRVGGYIVYSPSTTHRDVPKEISSNSSPANAIQLLEIQMRMIKEVSGVSEAMQGQRVGSGTPSSLYAQMVNNSIISIKDAFEVFFDARRQRDWKMLKLIQQYYKEDRYLNVAGGDYQEEALHYSPDKAQDVEFDMVIVKSANSPTYRDQIEERLDIWLQNGLIDLPMYLENSSLPFRDNLLASIQRKQEAMMAQQQDAMAQMPPQQ
jgi:hypothetical protein